MSTATIHPLVKSFLASCRVERGLAENTIEAYRLDLAAFLAFLGDTPVKSVVRENLSTYLASLGADGKAGGEGKDADIGSWQ